ncbi:MAG: hypothetical protein LBO00_00345 [Zoogloeaceae bacterium]|jgi:hypothetical protein|nr:hypothetical protein [Zoogloeaceae bacterium]
MQMMTLFRKTMLVVSRCLLASAPVLTASALGVEGALFWVCIAVSCAGLVGVILFYCGYR